jgi:anaerobic selenocysteine-containing dehydrogenase
LIEAAARLYASSHPSCLFVGNATDGTPDSFQANRALSMLMAVTGNLDIPGGDLQELGSGFRWCDTEGERGRIRGRWSSQMELRESIPLEMREKSKIGPRFLPDFRYTNPKAFVESVLEGKPYSIQAAFVQGSNPLSSWNNIMKVRDAFNNLDFLVVSDLFMTPTAALADIVFPVAGFLEFDGVRMGGGGGLAQFQRKVAQVGRVPAGPRSPQRTGKETRYGRSFLGQHGKSVGLRARASPNDLR